MRQKKKDQKIAKKKNTLMRCFWLSEKTKEKRNRQQSPPKKIFSCVFFLLFVQMKRIIPLVVVLIFIVTQETRAINTDPNEKNMNNVSFTKPISATEVSSSSSSSSSNVRTIDDESLMGSQDTTANPLDPNPMNFPTVVSFKIENHHCHENDDKSVETMTTGFEPGERLNYVDLIVGGNRKEKKIITVLMRKSTQEHFFSSTREKYFVSTDWDDSVPLAVAVKVVGNMAAMSGIIGSTILMFCVICLVLVIVVRFLNGKNLYGKKILGEKKDNFFCVRVET